MKVVPFSRYQFRFVRFLIIILFVSVSAAEAQISFTAPVADTTVKACDDFATNELHNPWDMSDTADVNRYFLDVDIQGFSSPAIASGTFSGVTTNAGSAFYMFSPIACGAHPVGGRYGQSLNIDTNKYKQLTFRMFNTAIDPFGYRLIWDRDCNYAGTRTVTNPAATKSGWHTYTVDLSAASIDGGSNSTAPWTNGSVTGFAMLPTTVAGASVAFDWMRIEDPTSCGSTNVTYNSSTSGNNNLVSMWLDDDTNPTNGFIKQLVSSDTTGNGKSVSYSSLGTFPSTYKVVGLLDSDFRTLEQADPWDMESAEDILVTTGVSASVSNGAYAGTTTDTAPTIYFRVPTGGINMNKYSKLSFKLSRSDSSSNMAIFWDNGGGALITNASHHIGGDVYQIDLSGQAGWTGTTTQLILRPGTISGVTFSLDFLSLRASGFDSSRTSASVAAAATVAGGNLVVNDAPLIQLDEPNDKGGVAIRPWNMNLGDMVIFENLTTAADPVYSSESLTTFLPDVRTFDGVRGDFFKGTNTDQNFDPVNYSTFPFGNFTPVSWNAAEYRNLCFKLNIDRPFDLGGGSVARVLWKAQNQDFETTEDLVLIYDGWTSSRWYEYCMDLVEVPLENAVSGSWDGVIEAFRVDSHEFTPATSYYFDYIKLRKDDESKGKFTIVGRVTDPNDAATLSYYYNTAESTTGGTLIGSINENQGSLVWDTTGVPNGTYYVYGEANDGRNTTKKLATGRVIVNNGGTTDTAPVLAVDSPVAGTVCSDLQVKGYALHTDRFEDVASVEVAVDGNLFAIIHPDLYHPGAVAAYPSADSSSAGFDRTFDFSSISMGAHTVTVKALSTDGGSTTSSISINKAAAGCPTPVTDAPPAGVPVDPDIPDPLVAPTVAKAAIDAKGNFNLTVTVRGTNDVACTLTPRIGAKKTTMTNINDYVIAASSTSVTFKAAKVLAGNKTPFFIDVIKACGNMNVTSTAKKVAPKSKTIKLKTYAKVAAKIRKALKKTG